ncbi:sugar phosphate isomerase/epimerase [Streptomyces olivoverticillatus]|uniref:Sugar phosphate isomerase/epimerase n=1 Tax=Streptomyces olivoverticillatus TaxID=66427 RepID=A0A7W7LLC2_9ACTN|nr:sugar phosphate isomerase/epimerase family protein [Streptomyces olivoverticillatus]MBB4892272.1 sugar phosphate isomerase/epimerase [Streptomyces olivoverticillatus]
MKLAFSTLGVPGLPLRDVVRLAADCGYDGVELRAHPEEPVHPGSSAAQRAAAAVEFAAAGVEVLAVAGYARVAGPGPDEPVLAELEGLVRLAADLGARFVRVFPGGGGRPEKEADADAARRLGTIAPLAADTGVHVLLETHDSHRRAQDVERVLGPVGHGSIGALWDVLHTWLGGESPAVSFPALAPHLGYVQVKDVASAEDTAPLPLGAGVLPLGACAGVLSAGGWRGWLSWEYEKRWHPQAADFAQLAGPGAEYLRGLVAAART